MGIYTIQTPDGRKVKIEAADEATAIRGAQEWAKSSPMRPKPKGEGTRDKPYDLSGGQSRSSIPRGSFYRDPEGSIRRNDNGDAGNPIIKPASRLKAEAGAARDMATDAATYARRNALAPADAAREREKSMAFIQGYSGLGDEIRGVRSAIGTGVANLLGDGPGYSAREAYDARRSSEQQAYDRYRKERPVESAVNSLGGAVLNPLNILAGEFIGPARAAGSVRRAVVAGGALGAGYGAAGAQPGERVKGAVKGGAIGAATSGILQAGSNALAGQVARRATMPPSPQRELSRQGVDLTPGQMLGGSAQRIEDAMTSVPFTGDAIRDAQRRGIQSFDRAAMQRVLDPIGGTANEVGRAGMRDTQAQVSGAYQNALGGVTVAPDAQLQAGIQAVRQTPNLPPAVRADLDAFLGDVQARLAGPVGGATWKALDADLGAAIRAADAGSANQPSQRFLRDALIRLRDEVGGTLQRTNPPAFGAVREADQANAVLARVREASQGQGTAARDGLFTAGDLNRAVRGMDTSSGNRAYAQGNALLQDLAEPGMQVLPATVPDSGTALRSAFMASPQGLVVGAVTGIPAAIIYSAPVQRAFNAIYRAQTPGQATAGLQQLAQLAARQPALAPVVEQLRARIADPVDGQATAPARPVEARLQ